MILDFLNTSSSISEALAWIFSHELLYYVSGAGCEIPLRKVELYLLIHYHFKHHIGVSTKILHFIGVVAGKHFEDEEAKAVEINSLVVFAAQYNLGSNILRCSTNCSGL